MVQENSLTSNSEARHHQDLQGSPEEKDKKCRVRMSQSQSPLEGLTCCNDKLEKFKHMPGHSKFSPTSTVMVLHGGRGTGTSGVE